VLFVRPRVWGGVCESERDFHEKRSSKYGGTPYDLEINQRSVESSAAAAAALEGYVYIYTQRTQVLTMVTTGQISCLRLVWWRVLFAIHEKRVLCGQIGTSRACTCILVLTS
jgi:hypothetical protein